MKKNRALLFWLAVLFVFSGTMTILYATGLLNRSREIATPAAVGTATDSPTVLTSIKPVASVTGVIDDFEMTDQLGRKFHSDSLKGQIWVGSVFFANCASTCRMQNAEVAKLQYEYAGKGVRLVSITCDPDRDTVDRLANYARTFNADPDKWYFLTGDFSEVARIGNEMFGITVQRETHSDRLVLVNREGKVHGTYRSMQIDDVMKLRKDLDKLLAAESNEREVIAGTDKNTNEIKPDPSVVEKSVANETQSANEVAVSSPGS